MEKPLSRNPRLIVIISDLHMGAGPLDDFDADIELQFVAFLNDLSKKSRPVELVINGDFLEFVQSEPWKPKELRASSANDQPLCFTEQQSLAKLDSILRYHPNVFTALGRFLAGNSDHQICILPGNHDPDLFWQGVRVRLQAAIETAAKIPVGDRLKFHLDEVYRPASAPSVWIEHGHQHDRCNDFYIGDEPFWSTLRPPILPDRSGKLRLIECVGTRFLNKYLNQLDEAYPFVDNVKPFSKFLKSFGMSALAPGYGPVTAAVAVWGILKYVASTIKKSPHDLLGIEQGIPPSAGAVVAAAWERLPEPEGKLFVEKLRSKGVAINAPLPMLLASDRFAETILDILAENLDLAGSLPEPDPALLGIGGEGATLALAGGYVADESAELIKAARRAIQHSGAGPVIMGHTHESQDHPHGLNYVNTGSWTRYLRAQAGEQRSSWALLKRGAASHFPFNLLYAQIDTQQPDVVQ